MYQMTSEMRITWLGIDMKEQTDQQQVEIHDHARQLLFLPITTWILREVFDLDFS